MLPAHLIYFIGLPTIFNADADILDIYLKNNIIIWFACYSYKVEFFDSSEDIEE